jgi:hypothetical protein
MFSGFFGKGNNSGKTPPKDAVDSRALEVVEDDPDTAWSLWDNALAEQDSRFSAHESVPPQPANAPAAVAPAPAPVAAPKPAAPARPLQMGKPMPPLSVDIDIPTEPTPLAEKTLEQRKNDALSIVDLHHHRIANSIRSMWGYKECGVYINKLIMNGGDGMGHARIGFNQEAVEAMLVLGDLHDAQFGPAEVHTGFRLDGAR